MDESAALTVLEDIAAGDHEVARRRLMTTLERDADDAEALELLAYLEEAAAGDLPFMGPTDAEAPQREPDPLALTCLVCGGACVPRGSTLLNTRFASFFGWDVANHAATIHACVDCHHLHWFVAGAPGALQALGAEDDRLALHAASDFSCQVCTYHEATEIRRQLNTRGLTLFGLEWLNRQATARACKRCGYMHWGEGSWPGRVAPQGIPKQLHCLRCDGTTWHRRGVLLNSRTMTMFGLDWLDAGALVWACEDCNAMFWFAADNGL